MKSNYRQFFYKITDAEAYGYFADIYDVSINEETGRIHFNRIKRIQSHDRGELIIDVEYFVKKIMIDESEDFTVTNIDGY